MGLDISEEERIRANKELQELCDWETKEIEKVVQKLKDEGRFRGGLDGKYEEIDAIKKERNIRLQELFKKYKK